jgi:hypothetical protein
MSDAKTAAAIPDDTVGRNKHKQIIKHQLAGLLLHVMLVWLAYFGPLGLVSVAVLLVLELLLIAAQSLTGKTLGGCRLDGTLVACTAWVAILWTCIGCVDYCKVNVASGGGCPRMFIAAEQVDNLYHALETITVIVGYQALKVQMCDEMICL